MVTYSDLFQLCLLIASVIGMVLAMITLIIVLIQAVNKKK